MIKQAISLILLVISAFLNFKHAWDAFRHPAAEQEKMMSILGVSQSLLPYFGIFSFTMGLLLIFPKTFFIGNLLSAIIIVIIIAMSLRAGEYRIALIEIPFLAIPLVLIWLKYPTK